MKYIFALLPLLILTELFAQIGDQDALVLKDSGVERGTIVRREANGDIVFMRLDSSFQVIDQSNVLKELKVDSEISDARIKNLVYEPREGASLRFILEPGIAFSSRDGESTSLAKLDIIPSIGFGEVFSAGIGSGVRYPFAVGDPIIPVFLDMRFSTDKRVAPIIAVGGGLSFQTGSGSSDNGYVVYTKAGVVTKNFKGGSIAFFVGADFGEQRVAGEVFVFGRSFDAPRDEMVTSLLLSLAFTF